MIHCSFAWSYLLINSKRRRRWPWASWPFYAMLSNLIRTAFHHLLARRLNIEGLLQPPKLSGHWCHWMKETKWGILFSTAQVVLNEIVSSHDMLTFTCECKALIRIRIVPRMYFRRGALNSAVTRLIQVKTNHDCLTKKIVTEFMWLEKDKILISANRLKSS